MSVIKKKNHPQNKAVTDVGLFAQSIVTTRTWLARSVDHLNAAEIFLPHVKSYYDALFQHWSGNKDSKMPPYTTSMYFFHCALSLENSFKAVIIDNDKSNIQNYVIKNGKAPKEILTHALFNLAQKSGYQVNLDDEHSLRFLTRYGVWTGKYPFPKHVDETVHVEKFSNGKYYDFIGLNPNEIGEFLEFSRKIYEWCANKVG